MMGACGRGEAYEVNRDYLIGSLGRAAR